MATRFAYVTVGLAAVAVVLAGCDNSGSSSTSSSPSSSASSASTGDAVQTKALAKVKEYSTVPDTWRRGGGEPYKTGNH